MASDAIALPHLEGVYPLLDLLQVGFVLLGPGGEVQHASSLARRMLGRRIDRAGVDAMLGDLQDELVTRLLSGETWTTRWRDHHYDAPSGDTLDLAVRSVRVEREDGASCALLCFYDVSVEVALHRRYKELLARQEAINEELRRKIAEVLREHEDDHAQFGELLQIAPAIFASFIGEAEAAVRAMSSVVDTEQLDDAAVVVALREGHTLKGNSRGLGLNFIAGRAHAVEDLLANARKRGKLPDRAELAAGVADLRRAIERAVSMRGGLEGGAAAPVGEDGRAAMIEIAGALVAACDVLPPLHPVRARLEHALGTIDRIARIPLAQLVAYLRTTARSAAVSAGKDEPSLDVRVDDVAVPPELHAALQTALPHLVRNAVVHGLEEAGARVAAGKPSAGVITVEARVVGDELRVEVRDDGRGIDQAALAARVSGGEQMSLAALVFHPGLSSKASADLDAGRGMGTVAARAAIEQTGGSLAVESAPGRGTRFTAILPMTRAR